MIVASFVLGLAVVGAIGVYAYGVYLSSVKEAKAAKLAEAQTGIDSEIVEDFIRSRDRFLLGKDLLAGHVATSGFFDMLERVTLTNVRYSSLSLVRLADGTAEIGIEGTARSFNALAAQSAAFSAEKRVKRAIFSNIQLDPSGTVSFGLSADVDAKLFAFEPKDEMPSPGAAPITPPPAPAATSSTATTTP
jgi:hypothetical protein